MNYQLKHTEPFELETGLPYSTILTRINSELVRRGYDIDTTEWGYSLPKLLNCTESSISGFFVAAFIDYPEVTVSELALLTDVVIMGWGSCPTCGGELEHDETISQNPVLTRSIVVCNVCGYSTETTYETDEKY